MKTLIVISSKSPNPRLYTCIQKLYEVQIQDNLDSYKICVVDSDSSDFTNYKLVEKDFPDVDILYAKNKNYEYGAWKYALSMYGGYDKYFCIQDTVVIHKQINIEEVNDNCAFIHYCVSGYMWETPDVKLSGINVLTQSKLTNYEPLLETHFVFAQHSVFVVTKNVIEDIFQSLPIPPTDKKGSCNYERLFGLYFITKNIRTIDLQFCVTKVHGNRF